MQKLRDQFAEFVVLPTLASVLPWSWTYRLARQLSRVSGLFREVTDQAEAAARASGLFEPDRNWRRQYRLNRLIDRVDPWISRFRSDRWMDRYVEVEGAWPTDGPFLAAGLHWGTGLWALRHIRRHAGPVSMVLRPQEEWDTVFSKPLRYYLKACEREVARASCEPITATGPGLTARISRLFERGKNVLVLLDVPLGGNKEGPAVEFLDQPTYFATGIVNMAVQQKRKIVPYSIGLDFATGQRRLQIRDAIEVDETDVAMTQLGNYFNSVVRQQSPSWHFWHLHKDFL